MACPGSLKQRFVGTALKLNGRFPKSQSQSRMQLTLEFFFSLQYFVLFYCLGQGENNATLQKHALYGIHNVRTSAVFVDDDT